MDTNVVSQSSKDRPNPTIESWLDQHDSRLMYMSVISLTEMRVGLGLMSPGKKRDAISHWLERSVVPHFQDRILPVTSEIAVECGDMLAAAKRAGHTPDPLDALIAATARVNGFSVLTLNRKHFSALQVTLVDLQEAVRPYGP